MKKCSGCGEVKSLDEMSKGNRSRCKPCQATYQRNYRQNNLDKIRRNERARKQYKNPEVRQKHREYYQNNKDKWKVRDRMKKFGLTPEMLESLVIQQSGLCTICSQPLDDSKRNGLNVDHCHDSGIVRGLLCSPCNIGLGMFKDSSELMMNAALYIEGFKMRSELVKDLRP